MLSQWLKLSRPFVILIADMIAEGAVICELRAMDTIHRKAEIPLVNDLVTTGIDTGRLIDSGKPVIL